ncbi:MAG: hypothetical protein BRC26_02755 [Nanohaloarchaea archaeon QH_8_44_6]|nr:MAG: hypothetical protein BRC26_02755 [Nanohaloarchaea archaeon QH_8_44_6]
MDIEFFDPQKHDYFLEEFSKYSREPKEFEKEFFREFLEARVKEISEVSGISDDFKLYFAMTDESVMGDDLPINRHVHGYSFAEWMEGFDRDILMIRSVRDRENWKECLVNMLAHEMAHQEFYSIREKAPYSNWFNIIFEGIAMNRAEQVAEELGIGWQPDYRSEKSVSVSAEDIISVLDENRSYDPQSIFMNGEEPCEFAEGYNISYRVVKDITERKGMSLEELLKLEDSVMRKEVEESVDGILS